MSETSLKSGPDIEYQNHLAEGRFMIQRGVRTGRIVFFPRAVAPGTGEELEWVEASGRGVVYSTTVVRKRPPEADVNVALIDLDEGVRMMSRVEGIDAHKVHIGMAVEARIIRHEEGHLIVFAPAQEKA
ncbi:Zn-ribbon domain-containing OB-fold protein [Mesorhizobium sp. BHbdii]